MPYIGKKTSFKGIGRIRQFIAQLRIDFFLLYSNNGSFLITFFNFILEKTTLTILVPGVPHGYHGKKILLSQVKTRCACRFRGADYEYHNESYQNSCIS